MLVVFDARGRASVWRGRRRLAGPTRSLDGGLAALPPDADPLLARARGTDTVVTWPRNPATEAARAARGPPLAPRLPGLIRPARSLVGRRLPGPRS